MKVVEIVASVSARINTGNFEGTEFFVSVKGTVDADDPLDDPAVAAEQLARQAEAALAESLVRSYMARGKATLGSKAAVAKHHGLGRISG